MRQQFSKYEAIAVLDWQSVKVQEDSFARLYHEIFDRPRSVRWWVMAADARPLEAREAEERGEFFEKRLLGSGGSGSINGHLVWSINGKAVVCKKLPKCPACSTRGRAGEGYSVVRGWWWRRRLAVFSAPGLLQTMFRCPA